MTKPRVRIDLDGHRGNIFAMIGACRVAGRRAGMTPAEIGSFTLEAAASQSYDAAIAAARRHFDVTEE